MNGLALLLQEGLSRDLFAGHVFVFRGRAGSLWSKNLARSRSGQP